MGLAALSPMTACNFAVSDWCHPPQIHCIEQAKGGIRVQVSVLDADGRLAETGEGFSVFAPAGFGGVMLCGGQGG